MNGNSIDTDKINDWSIPEDQKLFDGIKWACKVTNKLKKEHWDLISEISFKGEHSGEICKRRFKAVWKDKIKLSNLKWAKKIKVFGNETERFIKIKKAWKEFLELFLKLIQRQYRLKKIEKKLNLIAEEAEIIFNKVFGHKTTIDKIRQGNGKWSVHCSWSVTFEEKSLGSLKRKNPDSEVSQQPAKRTCLEEKTADIRSFSLEDRSESNEKETLEAIPDEILIFQLPRELHLSDAEDHAGSSISLDEEGTQLYEPEDEDSDPDFDPNEIDQLFDLNEDLSLKRNPTRNSAPIQNAADLKKDSTPKRTWSNSETEKLFKAIRKTKTENGLFNWKQVSLTIPHRNHKGCRDYFKRWEDVYNKISWKQAGSRNIEITMNRSREKFSYRVAEGNEYKVKIKREGPLKVEWSLKDDQELLEECRDGKKRSILPNEIGRHDPRECYDRLTLYWKKKKRINMDKFMLTKGKKIIVKSSPKENYLESPKL